MPSIILPNEFTQRTELILKEEMPAFLASMQEPSPISVRWNPYKTETPPPGAAIPWNRYGRYLSERPSFTTDPLFHAGAYYVQEASSMFVEHIVRSTTEHEGARILDLCAAPGGKSTLYSTLAGASGIVVANEVIRSRAMVLADNIKKWGIGNTIVTNNDPAHFEGTKEWFDVVAVDAPCSGEGMFRKSPEAREEWNINNVAMCAARQRRILTDVWDALCPGGILIYSTCTFNREENEETIKWLAENYDCEDAGVAVPPEWNIEESEAEGIRCFRFWTHKVAGEGFFVAAIRKGGQKHRPYKPKARKALFTDIHRSSVKELSRWTEESRYMRFAAVGDTIYGYYEPNYADIKGICEYLNTIHSGVCVGQLFSGKLKPDHSLAMYYGVARDATNEASLDLENALRYLRKEESVELAAFEEGFNLVTYEGYPLGWAKRIGQRINNLYPKSQMILYK